MTTDSLETRVKGLEELVSRLNNNNAFGELRYGQPLTPLASLQATVAGLSAPLIGSPNNTFTKNNDTTLANITGLTINLAASSRYMFIASLDYTSSSVADLKFDFGPPASAVGLFFMNFLTTAGAVSASFFTTGATPISIGGNGGGVMIAAMQGMITTTTADVIQFRAAQNTAEVSNTTIATDSYIFAWKLP